MTTSVEYRLVVTDKRVELATSAIWRTVTYTFQGKPMAFRTGGRAHHFEVVMRVGTG
ncbi:MAG: hypothetical protein NTW76_13820 [Corynebacteriales bacterium]|nr:hypothetical protein [Mycobacteriales bacterium]